MVDTGWVSYVSMDVRATHGSARRVQVERRGGGVHACLDFRGNDVLGLGRKTLFGLWANTED